MDTPYPTGKNVSQYEQASSSLNIYLFITPNKMAAKTKVKLFQIAN